MKAANVTAVTAAIDKRDVRDALLLLEAALSGLRLSESDALVAMLGALTILIAGSPEHRALAAIATQAIAEAHEMIMRHAAPSQEALLS